MYEAGVMRSDAYTNVSSAAPRCCCLAYWTLCSIDSRDDNESVSASLFSSLGATSNARSPHAAWQNKNFNHRTFSLKLYTASVVACSVISKNSCYIRIYTVVKLLSHRWWSPILLH